MPTYGESRMVSLLHPFDMLVLRGRLQVIVLRKEDTHDMHHVAQVWVSRCRLCCADRAWVCQLHAQPVTAKTKQQLERITNQRLAYGIS